MRIDMKDLHTRLKRSEIIKHQSMKELERLECENHLLQDDNLTLKSENREQRD